MTRGKRCMNSICVYMSGIKKYMRRSVRWYR